MTTLGKRQLLSSSPCRRGDRSRWDEVADKTAAPAAAYPTSLQGMPSGQSAASLIRSQRAWAYFEEPDQLRRRTTQQESRRFGFVVAGDQDIHGFCQQCGEVVVSRVNVEPPAATPLPPELAGDGKNRPSSC